MQRKIDLSAPNAAATATNTAGQGRLMAREFDEAGYLARYPDVAAAVAGGGLISGHVHFLRWGRTEGREANLITLRKPMVHLHVPKTAGTSLRAALESQNYRVLSLGPQFSYNAAKHAAIDVFSGHIGLNIASTINGSIVTILREPVDRFISYYNYLVESHNNGREISTRAALANKYPISEFVLIRDCPDLIEDQFNSMTWLLAHDTTLQERVDFRKGQVLVTEDVILRRAQHTLSSASVVGFQDRMETFISNVNAAFDLALPLLNENVTTRRHAAKELDKKTVDGICQWVYLDIALYKWARGIWVDG